jgi:hypothetical protein
MHILRVTTVYEPEIGELPDEFRGVLTKQDRLAISSGPEFFSKLPNASAPIWLTKLLRQCADSFYELQFCSSGDAPYRPYFRFYCEGQPAISLPRRKALRRDVPAFLRRIYGIVGAFRENRFDEAGGLSPGDSLETLSQTGIWVEPESAIDPDAAVPFLETFSGSQLCYLPDGSGAWLEEGTLRRVKNLEREVARYFNALLKGSRI